MNPRSRSRPPEVEVLEETETPVGWSFRIAIHPVHDAPLAEPTVHTVTLSWVDHDHWTGGTTPPSVLVRRLLTVLAMNPPEQGIPAKFDAARVRRWVADLEDSLRFPSGPED